MELINNEIGLLSELAEKISREQRKQEKKRRTKELVSFKAIYTQLNWKGN